MLLVSEGAQASSGASHTLGSGPASHNAVLHLCSPAALDATFTLFKDHPEKRHCKGGNALFSQAHARPPEQRHAGILAHLEKSPRIPPGDPKPMSFLMYWLMYSAISGASDICDGRAWCCTCGQLTAWRHNTYLREELHKFAVTVHEIHDDRVVHCTMRYRSAGGQRDRKQVWQYAPT